MSFQPAYKNNIRAPAINLSPGCFPVEATTVLEPSGWSFLHPSNCLWVLLRKAKWHI